MVERESNTRVGYKISRCYLDVEINGKGISMTRGRLGTSMQPTFRNPKGYCYKNPALLPILSDNNWVYNIPSRISRSTLILPSTSGHGHPQPSFPSRFQNKFLYAQVCSCETYNALEATIPRYINLLNLKKKVKDKEETSTDVFDISDRLV
jgi:hypothetical protein